MSILESSSSSKESESEQEHKRCETQHFARIDVDLSRDFQLESSRRDELSCSRNSTLSKTKSLAETTNASSLASKSNIAISNSASKR